MEFLLPESPAHQRRIADILDKADAICRKRREVLALTDDLLRATFLEMFGDPVTNPKRWPEVELGALLDGDPQNGMYRPADDYGSGALIVRIDSYTRTQGIRWQELKRLRADATELERYALRTGEILVNRVNTRELVGKAAIVSDAPGEPVLFESNMMRLRPERTVIDPTFLVTEINSPRVVGQIAKAVKPAVNQASINQSDVRSFCVRVPPMVLQARFTEAVARIRLQVSKLRCGVEEGDRLFASLQHRAFRGEL